MTIFYLALVGLTAIPVLMILPALQNKRHLRVGNREIQNTEIARQRLDEINQTIKGNDALEQANRELQATLLEDIKTSEKPPSIYIKPRYGLLAALVIPIIGVSTYQLLGSPEFASSDRDLIAESHSIDPANLDINDLLQQLEARIEKEPGNAEGWTLAARTNMRIQNYPKAERAYTRLNELVTGNADFLTEWADATIMANGNTFNAEAKSRVEKALAINPKHINALWIAGLGAGSLGNTEEALGYFERLSPLVKNDQNTVDQIDRLIAQYRQQIGLPLKSENLSKSTGKTIQVIASIAADLQKKIDQDDTVFIIAKAKNGPPAPLAVSRHVVKELPITVILTKDMAMLPNMTIENFDEIEVVARISKSGNAIAQAGDIASQTKAVTSDNITDQIALVIDQTIAE